MTLTATDLQSIRIVVREENLALERDIKELYRMATKTQRAIDKMQLTITKMQLTIAKMQLTITKMQRGLSAVANHVGVSLPH
jgi:uncharacterized coiled-coil protein SlyX